MKKSISKIVVFLLMVSMIICFVGCSKNDNKKFELVMITDGNSITDGSYNQSAWNGIKKYAQENDISYRYYQPNKDEDKDLTNEEITNYVDLAVNGGAKYIVLPGDNFSVFAYETAPTYKDVNFLLIDAYPHSQSDESIRLQSNVMCISYDSLQAGFLAGYVSVIDGNSKLGYFGSVTGDKSGNYGAGYVQGAAYAADQLSIPVKLDYANYNSPSLKYDYTVNLKATYKKISDSKDKTFNIKVVGGSGSGTYTDGENVAIIADKPDANKKFDHWEVKSNTTGVKDKKVNISSKKKSTMNLLVSKCDATITAIWADTKTCPVTVYQANSKNPDAIYNVEHNSSVGIEAPIPLKNTVFDHWEVVKGDKDCIEDVNSKNTKVNVKDSEIIVNPVFVVSENPTFDVVVTDGTGSGSYLEGDKISVIANTPKKGYMFDKWENIDNQGDSTGIAMENEYNYNTSFEMVDRYASVVEKMFDDGTSIVFAGGNKQSNSVFDATKDFNYKVYGFGSGTDEKSQKNCYASVVNDYSISVYNCLSNFNGSEIYVSNCQDNGIYVTGKNVNEFKLDEDGKVKKDKDGKEIKNDDYNKEYANVYDMLAKSKIKLVPVQTGGDVSKSFNSKCLTLNYWTK